MEHTQKLMTPTEKFNYRPGDHECEKASNSYLMSLVALMAGLPLPIINLIASFIFYMGNRKGTFFVRWHCTQALLSQLIFLCINSVAFWWTVDIIFTDAEVSNRYFGYLFTAIGFNVIEIIATIYTAIQTRKGIHIEWNLFAPLTDLVVKP